MSLVEVWIEHPIAKIDQTFTYFYSGEQLSRGIRVIVPFNNQEIVGFVDHTLDLNISKEDYEKQNGYKIKNIIRVLDKESLLNDELWQLGKWLSEKTISPQIACFQAMLPNKLSPKSTAKPVKELEYVVFSHDIEFNSRQIKQKEALDFIKEHSEGYLRSEWRKLFGTSSTKTLEDKGCVLIEKREARFIPEEKEVHPSLKLTKAQQKAFDEILNKEEDVILLHGATGSGKTEIYLQLAQKTIEKGQQVLFLVPEIGLTPQMVNRVEERFGSDVAIYHSKLNDQERYEQFMLVKEHKVHIVVGTRSACFMPFDNLGLIVIDEEHDHSYKQMSLPYYHCREVSKFRGQYHKCKVLLGSATPSLESYARALKGVYGLVTLNERVNNQPLPKCYLIDTAKALKNRDNYIITKPLRDAIKDRLDKHEQIIILLNRRGYDPVLRCADCLTPITCSNCDLALNYHKDINKLVCHTCGLTIDVPDHCDKCGSTNIKRLGYGTQRLEEELYKFFPNARVLRMDTDSVGKKHAHQEFLEAFGREEADILIGTQMIAKGLDYPKVTLVGVLSADALLVRSDFRSVETTFDLVVQASGRSGRSKDIGEVYIQAFDINHYGIRCASHHDYLTFFNEEMKYRHLADYPPYTYLTCLTFAHKDLDKYQDALLELANSLKEKGNLTVLGPSELVRTFDKQRKRIIIKAKDENYMIDCVRELYNKFINQYSFIQVVCDVNPLMVE